MAYGQGARYYAGMQEVDNSSFEVCLKIRSYQQAWGNALFIFDYATLTEWVVMGVW